MTSNPVFAEKAEQRPGHAGRRELARLEPLIDRPLLERVSGKKVVFAFCDRQFEDARELVFQMASFQVLPSDMTLMKWSDLRSQLPFITADIIVVASLPPEEVLGDPAGLAAALRHFRQRNPDSSVVMLSVYGPQTPAGGVFSFLAHERLVDQVESGAGVQYDQLLRRGADLHELKAS